jgi:hypothetical protein
LKQGVNKSKVKGKGMETMFACDNWSREIQVTSASNKEKQKIRRVERSKGQKN